MTLYFLSGLGADERLYQFIDVSNHRVVHLKWIKHSKNETMSAYALRMAEKIDDPESVLIGVSFGGMLSIEIAKEKKISKVILISSATGQSEIPKIYRMAGVFRLHKLMPGKLLKKAHRLMNWVMGSKDSIRKTLLASMLQESDPDFLTWAIDQVVTWKNNTIPNQLYRIHGTNIVLPLRSADYIVKGGTHIAVATHGKEVTKYIEEILSK